MASNLTKNQQQEVKKEVDKEVKKQLSKHLFEKTYFLGSEFKKHTSTAIIAAFGFIIALVWRDLIVKFVQENLSSAALDKYPYLDLLITAIVVTAISVLGIALVSRWARAQQ